MMKFRERFYRYTTQRHDELKPPDDDTIRWIFFGSGFAVGFFLALMGLFRTGVCG